ncbi:MAG TPA: hypothetical protein VNN20_01270 [Thermodesulfobacteriota bacterium]|nr:hypothetical protein [Thermodesulfobacteriota bacterium]
MKVVENFQCLHCLPGFPLNWKYISNTNVNELLAICKEDKDIWIKCRNQNCQERTWANDIVDLIDNHTDTRGRLKCSKCGISDAYIYRKSNLQEKDKVFERWIKGVIRITTPYQTYSPYVYLISDEENGDITGIHFNYYKDARSKPGGKLKHGHGPGGVPVLSQKELLDLIEKLISFCCLSVQDIKNLLDRFEKN